MIKKARKPVKYLTRENEVVHVQPTADDAPEKASSNEAEMRRDREFRLLNEKIRGQEYKLRELEAQRKEQEMMTAVIAEKVEQRLLKKLYQNSTKLQL